LPTWWHTPVIPAFWQLRQEDLKFQATLGYIARLSLQKQNKTKIYFPDKRQRLERVFQSVYD
jgi:hypothetical protein